MDNGASAGHMIEVVRRFNQAINQQNLEEMMELVSEDCRYENTYPPPEGTVFEGKEQVRMFWTDFFTAAIRTEIIEEEIFAHEDRCVMRWVYQWEDPSGNTGHIRGVDLYRLRDSKITEKLSYVKG